uniref:PDZ and LIM domain protein 7 n=1 Tax=Ailuropoda melanoleuca TaxID=9646 RepID=A0A7N5JUN2_AILME
MESFKVVLEGPAPWGFRLQGGKDFNVPLSISRLTPGGKAAQAGVAVGDWVLSIDGENAGGLTHIEAQNKIRACGERLSLGLSRAQLTQSKPQKALAPAADPPRYTFAPSASLNKTARPFGAPLPADSALQQNGQPLRPLVPDASKQRLMEDTEDWRPRPGTGQSRSFRILAHLTGTEFMQDPDEEHLKKSSQVPRTEVPAPASATLQEPWPAQAGPTTLSPTSRPPWAVDPTFAERYAPDKTSTVLTRHSQPATPTPLQNRTSIVQAAAGGGTGTGGGNNGKTPVCHHCHKVIRGRYLVALGHAYHPEEFVCSQCGKVLEEGGFFEEKGAIFCPPCYDVRYAPSCAKCKKKITGTMRRCLARNAGAATSRSTQGTASWRRWASAGTTLASCVRYAISTWKERLSTPRRTSPSARATPSPMCEPLPPMAASSSPARGSSRSRVLAPDFWIGLAEVTPTPTPGLSLGFPGPCPVPFISLHSLHFPPLPPPLSHTGAGHTSLFTSRATINLYAAVSCTCFCLCVRKDGI